MLKKVNTLLLFLILLVLVAGLVLSQAGSINQLDPLIEQGSTNFDTLELGDGTAAAPALTFASDTDTGFYRIGANNIGWAQGGSLAFDINSGGGIDFVEAINQTLVNAASGSANPYDWTGTLGIMNGSDSFAVLDLNFTNADHTGSSNTVRGLDISGLTGDTHAQENAIELGAGWDLDIDGATSLELGVDNTAVVTVKDPAAADGGTTTDSVEIALTTPVDTTGTNTHNGLDVAVTVGNASGGTNTINAINVTNITGDAQVTERGVHIGTGYDVGLNVAGGGAVIVGTVTVDTGEIGAGEVADVVRYINFPLNGFIECQTDAGALIGFDTTADALPDYVNSATDGTGLVIRFDDTGSSEDQGSEICNQFTVPADYVSGGAFVIRALKDAHAGATEVLNCAVSVNGAALQAAGTTTTTASASTSYTCTPTIASLAAGDSVSFYLSITSGTTMDDGVDIASVSFSYTATQ